MAKKQGLPSLDDLGLNDQGQKTSLPTLDELGLKKKDQASQLTQQPSIDTSSSASGQSGQSSGQEGSALAILRKYAELSQTPGTAEYKMRQNEIARQKAAPQPLVEEKPVFDITQVDLPEMAQSSTVVTQKQAPSSVEELEKLKKQQEKYYAKAETAASATLYSKTGSVKKSDQYNWLYNASEDEREDFKNTLKSEGYGDKAIEQIFSKADTQAVSNLGQNKSSEFQDSIIKEMAPLKGVLSDAEFNKAFQDRISNKSLEYGIDQLDAYDKESYPIIKEWWDINNKLKDPNFTGPQRDKAIQTAIDLNSKLKSIREGQGDLINPLTGQQDKVYTDKVKQEEGSFASQSFDNLLNVRQQRMFELMAAEENYKNARKQHANIQLNSQNIPYSEYSKLLEASQKEKDRYDNAYYEAKSKFDAVNRSLLLNENPASVERGLASGYGFLPALGEGLVEGFGGNVSTDEDFKQNFVKGLQEKGVSVTKEQVDAAQLNIGQKVGSAIGNSIPAMAQIALAEIATQGAGTLKAIPEIEKIFKAIEAASEANKAFKYGAIMTEGAVKYGLTPSDDLTAAMGAGEELAQKAFDGMNIAPALAKTKWGKFLAIGARSLGGGLAETAAEYGGEYVDALTKNGYNVEEAFKTAVGRDYDEAKDKLLVTFLTSTLFSGTSNVASALVARNYYEAKGDTQRVEEIDNIAKENGIDLEKAKADFDKKVPTPSESTYTKTQEDLIKTTVEQTGKPKQEVEKQLVEEGKIPDLSKENVPTTETPAGKQETTQTQIQDDQENKQGLPSEVQGGQKPITTKPKQETSGGETAPSGVLQTQGKEEVNEPSKVESSDYKMQHKIVRDEESTTTLDDMTKGGNLVPDDFYTKPQYYADLSSPSVKESLKVIKEAKGKPEKEITIYRAVPEGVKDINNGDWVSLSETYAKEHGMHPDDPSKDMPVISMKVKASEIVWDGNDVNEFAYFKSEQPVIESETTQQEPTPVVTPKQTTLKTAAGKETSTTEENQKQTENENNRGTKKESPTKDFTGNKGKEAEKVRGRGKTPRDKRKIRNEGLKKALASEPKNIRERVLQWFISGGKINTEGFQKLFGDKKTSKWASEARKRINLWDAKKGDTIDGVAHQIWEESGQTLDIQDIRDQVEDVLLSHNVTVSMADEINSANMEEEAIYKSLSEQEQESVDLNEEAEDYWDSLTDEEKEVLVNENILPEDFYKEEKVSPLEKTNTEKAAEAQRMLADKFRKLKIKKPDAGNLFASTPFDLAWDGALEVIAKSLEASASVTEAAGKALEHIKNSDWYKGLTSEQKAKAEQNLKTHIENEMSSFEAEQKPTEEPAKKEEVKVSGEPKAGKERETKKRGTVEQLEKDEVHQDMLKDVPESDKEYVTERVAEWDTDAAEIMNSKDISSARSIFDANKIPPFVRVRLGGMLISKYEELASKETNESERIKYLDAAWDVADLMIKMEAGKTLKAFHGMTLLTPQGIVRGIKRQYEDKAKKAKERNKSVINNINDAVKKGRATAAKEVASEAKKKYKEKIKPITTFGLTIDEIKDRKKAALEKLKASRGNLTSGGLSKESIEAISEYGAMLFAEGIHNFKEWASKMKSDIPEVSNSDLSHIWDNTKSLNDKTLKQLSEEGDFETIVSNHFINNPEASLSEKLQEVFGISPEQAESISESLNKDFKKSAKKHVEDAMGKLTTWRKISVEEIINGNLTEKKDISKAILDAKGIKTELTEEQENELLERAKKIQQVPAGSLRNQAMIDLMNDVSKDLGSTSKTDLFMALWYASILSGPETQLVNTISNVMNMASEGYVSAMQRAFKNKNPKELINAIPNFFKNWNEALSESKEVLSNGTKKAVVLNTADSSVLENTKFKNLLYPLNAAKYVGRVMTATDTLFYFKNLDMRKKTLATEIANKEGLSGEALNKRVSDILYNTEDHIEAAMIQAEKDLADTKNLTGKEYNENDVRIRAAEIIDEKIAKEHPELHDQAHSFAAYATFNYDPEGIIGAAAMKIAEFTTAYPKLKFVLPFTRIVANVLNQALDYSPVTGLRRAAGLTSIKNQTPEAKQRRLIKSLTGLMLMTTAYALHEMYSDDEDPAFEITGGGPEDPAKKREWMQTHKPYSIKIGNTYFSYKYSPIGMTMSILGDWIDGFKYNNISEKDIYERAGYALTSSASSIADMSFISTLGGLLEVFSKNDRKGLETKTDKAVSLGLRPITGLVPNAFKQTYGYFDRTVYETKGIKATLLRDLPFVNSLYLKPKLNALGDPIEKWGTRIVANKPDDEIWNFLSEKNVNIPPVGYGTELLGVEMNDDEYYLFVKKTGGKVKEEITRRLSELRLMKSDELREEIKDISDRAKKKSKKEMIKEIGREELKKRLKK